MILASNLAPQALNPYLATVFYIVSIIGGLAIAYGVVMPLIGKTPGRVQRFFRDILGVEAALERQTVQTKDAISQQTRELSDSIGIGQTQSTQAIHELTTVVNDNHHEALDALQRHISDPNAHHPGATL